MLFFIFSSYGNDLSQRIIISIYMSSNNAVIGISVIGYQLRFLLSHPGRRNDKLGSGNDKGEL